ncbi:unnamed protein product [Phytophthora lilii]|uniref:Unnamed protein product n=1 Tax=Phytophthora lilii TaxID=2077276 RepID=A0A9W6U160_9STRA|nr:unnamed protein product [Phytophthora lilii]
MIIAWPRQAKWSEKQVVDSPCTFLAGYKSSLLLTVSSIPDSAETRRMFELSSSKDEFVSAYTDKLEVGAGADDADRNGLTLGRWSVGLFGCFGDCVPNGLNLS